MRKSKAITLIITLLLAATASAQDRSTGGIKGKVRAKGQGTVTGVSVTVRQHDREVARAVTDGKGEFVINGLAPGIYGLTLHKEGLSVGTLEDIQVKAGKTTGLPDHLVLTENEASVARLWSSVFNEGGLSIPNVRIELSRVEGDGTARKIDGRLTNESGQAVFRLSPNKATYRITVKAEGKEPQSKDVEIDGAAVYRVAFTIQGQLK
ncbi:MAG TPA: carboxypeptidase-like regulatory domain-containing protein [Pyrinomonadaceae bacterium]